jgi:anti-sigma factor RsiW
MKHVVDDLSALLDGALDPAARRAVEAHLAACPACRGEQGRIEGALRALARLPAAPEPSPWFATRLAARLANEPRRGWLGLPASWRWRLAVPAAGLAAVAAAGVIMVRHQRGLELGAAAALDLLQEYETVASVGDVETAEDAALIAHLDMLEPGGAL